jgi:hypothetical protein
MKKLILIALVTIVASLAGASAVSAACAPKTHSFTSGGKYQVCTLELSVDEYCYYTCVVKG